MPSRSSSNPPAVRGKIVNVSIPAPLRKYCGGAPELTLNATNLREVLAELEQHYPELHRSICDETGAVRRHINLFVNTQLMRDLNGLDTSLELGDVVTVMTAVSGG